MLDLKGCHSHFEVVISVQEKDKSRYVSRVVNYNKIISNIRQHFSCVLDKGIEKVRNEFNSHNSFLRADQDRSINCCQMV